MNRRSFVQSTSGALGLFSQGLSALSRETQADQLERRTLGKTGEKLSIIGFGGIVVSNASTQEASQRVEEAILHGVNYFDVAPSYGNAEDMLGPALEPFRKKVFLACKTQKRSKAEAAEELAQSLKKMRTEYFDLYQLHAVASPKDVQEILGPGGALEAFAGAKKEGKIRFIGFSAHSMEAATRLIDQFPFDTILYPVNQFTWHAGNFGPQALEKALQKQMGILALKSMAKGPWEKGAVRTHPKCWYEPLVNHEEALLALRFTLSHPVTAALPPGDENLFKMALGLAKKFSPLSEMEKNQIKEKASKGQPIFQYPSANWKT
jgi:predicted aldo/keto reductase-like oxidoreductase